MDQLRDMFNSSYFTRLSEEFKKEEPSFNQELFIEDVTRGIENLSLNERMRQTSLILKKHLPDNYVHCIELMTQVIPRMNYSYTQLVFPDFVGLFGHEHFYVSMKALAYFTSFGSSEFAIREFLVRDFEKTIKVMYKWSENENFHVRRLSSEGSRPRLPWSFNIAEIIKNPRHTLPILENLKADPELYVKKSVANHLNDISKDWPDYMLDLVESWGKDSSDTKWIVKRGCRTLVKNGNHRALALFECDTQINLEVLSFSISHAKLRQDEKLAFHFNIKSTSGIIQKIIIDYRIHYCKKLGSRVPKVFKLKELELLPNQEVLIKKTQLFKDLTTRKHYSGKHQLDILINGNVVQSVEFDVVCSIGQVV
jgi:3-methyladenine DNA glycosylase AlkC